MDNKKKKLDNLINEKVDGEKIKGGNAVISNNTDPMAGDGSHHPEDDHDHHHPEGQEYLPHENDHNPEHDPNPPLQTPMAPDSGTIV